MIYPEVEVLEFLYQPAIPTRSQVLEFLYQPFSKKINAHDGLCRSKDTAIKNPEQLKNKKGKYRKSLVGTKKYQNTGTNFG